MKHRTRLGEIKALSSPQGSGRSREPQLCSDAGRWGWARSLGPTVVRDLAPSFPSVVTRQSPSGKPRGVVSVRFPDSTSAGAARSPFRGCFRPAGWSP